MNLKYLDEDENMGIREEDIEFIKKYWKDDVPHIELNNNRPIFTEDDKKRLEESVNPFSDLNTLGRCGVAFAYISKDTVSSNSDKRPQIHSKPSGFPKSDEKLIFERCHLIGYNLYKIRNDKCEENANLKKIFTGTRFMNNVMYYYEKKIYDYVYGRKNHVLYHVTPYFKESNKHKFDVLVSGVQMEAMFINENGNEDIDLSFNVFVYNKQPYIELNYETGKYLSNKMSDTDCIYVIDKKKNKFHINDCASAWDFDDDRIGIFLGKRKNLIHNSYNPCAICDQGSK